MRAVTMLIVLLIAVTLPAVPGSASPGDFKSGPHFGGGFVSNAPTQWLGFCLLSTDPDKVGFYFDLKTSVPMVYGGDDYYDNISVYQAESWGDRLISERSTWLSVDVALTKVVSRRLALYIGAGYSANVDFRNYKDEFHILGTNGSYWVDSDSTDYMNGIGGVMMLLGASWGLQLGGEVNPAGMTLGVFWIS